nr:MAG TPA: protein of unknown function DUF2828 [Caudoviricetes sp.]
MEFMDQMENTLGVVTENGAKLYAKTDNALVDLNFMVGSMRRAIIEKDDIRIKEFDNKFMEAYDQYPFYTTLWMFYLRDPRNGLGERDLFRHIIGLFITERLGNYKSYIPLLECAIEHGRFDDFIKVGMNTDPDKTVECIDELLREDIHNRIDNKPISLLAKWMPSITTSNKNACSMARHICKKSSFFGNSYKLYARTLKDLRNYLRVVESQMSRNKWDEIDYSKVPSKANVLYGNAFLNHDENRRRKFLDDVISGKAKVNTGTLFPYELVRMIKSDNMNEDYLNTLWNSLPVPKQKLKNTLVVRDGSSSMFVKVSGSTTAMDIGDSLTLYIAKHSEGCFHNKFITFSAYPKVVNVDPDNFVDSVAKLRYNNACDTDIIAVFKLILDTAIKNKLKQEELPDKIVIVSDMEFNEVVQITTVFNNGVFWSQDMLFEHIEKMFKDKGYELPHLVFWNVNNRNGGIPVIKNERGLTLMSGFSAKAFDMLLTDKLDAWEALKEILDSPVFSDVAEVIQNSEPAY